MATATDDTKTCTVDGCNGVLVLQRSTTVTYEVNQIWRCDKCGHYYKIDIPRRPMDGYRERVSR